MLLPFLRIDPVLSALDPLPLTDNEHARDVTTCPIIYVHPSSPLAKAVHVAASRAAVSGCSDDLVGADARAVPVRWADGGGLGGELTRVNDAGELTRVKDADSSGDAQSGAKPIDAGAYRCYTFTQPSPPTAAPICAMLPGATPPPPTLSLADLSAASHARDIDMSAPRDDREGGRRDAPCEQRRKRGGGARSSRAPAASSAHVAPPAAQGAAPTGGSGAMEVAPGGFFGFSAVP